MYDASGLFQLTIRPNDRSAADEYYHQGQTWIEGREGSKYTINVRNNSYSRILAIISVDGLDILEGKPAGHLSRGYVINAQSDINVPGWKVDNTTAAEFFFSRSNKSYVAQIGGDVNNTGVIGAMIFKEQQQPISYWPNITSWNGSTNNTTNGISYNNMQHSSQSILRSSGIHASASNAGTGFGNATDWATTQTTFVREHSTVPNAILAIYYDTAKNLQRMGIQMRTKSGAISNNPFPAYNVIGVTPPPGWTK